MRAIPKAIDRRSSSAAFSLVEVTLALALFSVALLSLVGLIPLCLQSARQSIDITRQTAILNYIASDLEQVGFSKLGPSNELRWTFDSDGRPVSVPEQIHYTVRGDIQGGTQLPGMDHANDNLLTVKLDIAFPGNLRKTSLTVANMGD